MSNTTHATVPGRNLRVDDAALRKAGDLAARLPAPAGLQHTVPRILRAAIARGLQDMEQELAGKQAGQASQA